VTELLRVPTKDQAEALRWLYQAADRDRKDHSARVILQYVAKIDGALITCDGYRMHAVQRFPGSEDWPKLWQPVTRDARGNPKVPGSLPKAPGVIEAETDTRGYEFPDMASVLPRQEPAFTIVAEAGYLREALTGLTGPVKLVFYDQRKAFEVHGKTEAGSAYALIMPMDDKRDPVSTWKPEPAPKPEPEPEAL
jgi:hypothetical protein